MHREAAAFTILECPPKYNGAGRDNSNGNGSNGGALLEFHRKHGLPAAATSAAMPASMAEHGRSLALASAATLLYNSGNGDERDERHNASTVRMLGAAQAALLKTLFKIRIFSPAYYVQVKNCFLFFGACFR